MGIDIDRNTLNPNMFEFQKDIVRWALKKGRAAIFAECGLGKTLMQLSWADEIHKHTGGKILILAPLAVAPQTKDEGEKFGISVNICESQDDVIDGISLPGTAFRRSCLMKAVYLSHLPAQQGTS